MSRGLWWALGLILVVAGRGVLLGRQLLAPVPSDGERVLVRACVRSIPAVTGRGWRFDARVSFPRNPGWPARNLRIELAADAAAAQAGECWRYAARVSAPRGAAAGLALLRAHLSGYARVDAGPLNKRLSRAAGGMLAIRARLARRFQDQVADPSAAALLAALAVGATGDVSPRQWQVFNNTGITHLVAISGMHVTFFALLAMSVARGLWWALAPRTRRPRRSVCAALTGGTLALWYALLSGFSVPAQRTVVMLSAFLAVRECSRRTSPMWSLAVALAAVLLYDPFALLGAGFWLSFVAVAAIGLLPGGRLREPPAPRAALTLQGLVSLALLPITAAAFGTFPAGGLLVNLLAIPVFTLLLVPPVLIATACFLLPGPLAGWCGDCLAHIAGGLAAMLWPGLCWCAGLPGALWHAAPPWSWYLLAVPAVLLGVLPLAARLRFAALALLVTVFALRAPRPPVGELWIDARGGGDSTAMLLRTHTHLLLVGTGEVYGSSGRHFARTLLPLLRASGYGHIDMWLPGPLTRDSRAALRLAAAELPVRVAVLPARQAPPPEMRACSAASWLWDGVRFSLRDSADGRHCMLTATRGARSVEFGTAAAASLAASGEGRASFVLGSRGLVLRNAFLRL